MIIARATDPQSGDEMLMLGLSTENVTRLLKGQLIHIRRESHGAGVPEGWEIVIFYGTSEQEMKAMLERGGLIGPDTELKEDPKLRPGA